MKLAEHIARIVVHCSATRARSDIGVEEIRSWHVNDNGWPDIGYHYVIRRDGTLEAGRPIDKVGFHVKGYNRDSIGICLVGGLDPQMQPEDNFTFDQYDTLADVISGIKLEHPHAEVLGHRDLSPDIDGDGIIEEWEWLKACPCFDVKPWWASVGHG